MVDCASFLKLYSCVRDQMQVLPGLLSYTSFARFSIADIWLHFSTTTISLYATYPTIPVASLKPSVAFNLTLCAGSYNLTCSSAGPDFSSDASGSIEYVGPPSAVQDVGNPVASNASDAFQVLTLESSGNNLTAVIVPITRFPKGISFQSTSFGMGATCENVKNDIEFFPNSSDSITLFVHGSEVNFKSNATNIPSQSFTTYNLPNSTTPKFFGLNITNPFGMVQLMQWPYDPADTQEHINPHLTQRITYVWFTGVCTISVYDVVLLYTNGTYHLINRTLSAQNTTTLLFTPFIGTYFSTYFSSRMVINLASQLRKNHTDFPVEVARQISQLGIALNAGLFSPDPMMSNVTMQRDFLASRYPISSLTILWASAGLYLLLGIGLLARAANEKGDTLPIESPPKSRTTDSDQHSVPTTSTLALAQQWITNPSAIIAEHFVLSAPNGNREANALASASSIQKSAMKMFGDETETGRLGIGIQGGLSRDGLKSRIFRVGYQDQLEVEVEE
jgi:hypothetical protein